MRDDEMIELRAPGDWPERLYAGVGIALSLAAAGFALAGLLGALTGW